MTDSVPSTPMSSAAGVWRHLVNCGVLQPASYDEDIATLLNAELAGAGDLAARMEVAGWNARDLLRAMASTMDSFAVLIRDLLSLYTNIAATHATNENLTISYEFDEGDAFDQSLAQFRSAVATLDRAKTARGSFVLSPQRWNYPSAQMWSFTNAEVQTLRDGGWDRWGFTLPVPPETGDPAVARGVSLVYAVLTAACDTLQNYGATMHAVSNSSAFRDRDKNEVAEHQALFFDFTDYFPEAVILGLRADVEYLTSRPSKDVYIWLREVENWCSSFWKIESCDAESALESVLSLPMWGKRHELYSAWAVCVIAEAFKGQNLRFEVVNGRLNFPFKATKIASFEDRGGSVELWAEVRSIASGELAHGRKHGVQPDYRFLRPGQEDSETEMAIEVKHYRNAAAARHGDTARDYARALPKARVLIVAHDPIGKTAIDRVNAADRDRVTFRENVRSLLSPEAKALIAELTDVFPPDRHVKDIEVMPCRVNEVEVRLIAKQVGPGRSIILCRGKRIQVLEPSTEAEVVLEIVCHPEKRHTIDVACPRVAITFSDGEVRGFEAVGPNCSRSWHIGSLGAASFTMSTETKESVGDCSPHKP